MAFRKFIEFGASARDTVTIRNNDLVFISDSLLNQANARDKSYVYIHIDEKSFKIGIQFLDEEPSDYNFRKITKEKAGGTINLSAVLRFFGVKKLMSKHIAETSFENGLLVFSIESLVRNSQDKE